MFVGVEIGGTKQQLCVTDEQGNLVERVTERFPIPNGAPDILSWIARRLPTLLQKYPSVRRVGVGFGGPVETATGGVLLSVQVKGWKDFHLKTWFEETFHLPTVVVNDTVAGGYAEMLLGAGRGFHSFYYTNIGTGIGGAMFMGGKTFDGVGRGGVYMGNTYVATPCGAPGEVCRLEEVCCGGAIEKRLRAPGTIPEKSLLYTLCGGDTSTLTCKELGEAARAGDETALRHLDIFAKTYGVAIANFISLFSPERVAIGGGVANMGEVLLEPVRRVADQYVFASARGQYDIVPCQLMDDNVIIGAALYARDGMEAL